jgi:hypothetical protein
MDPKTNKRRCFPLFFPLFRKHLTKSWTCNQPVQWLILDMALATSELLSNTRTISRSTHVLVASKTHWCVTLIPSSPPFPSCLQAAYTVGCNARGIECHKSRNAVAQILSIRLSEVALIHQNRDGMVCSTYVGWIRLAALSFDAFYTRAFGPIDSHRSLYTRAVLFCIVDVHARIYYLSTWRASRLLSSRLSHQGCYTHFL